MLYRMGRIERRELHIRKALPISLFLTLWEGVKLALKS